MTTHLDDSAKLPIEDFITQKSIKSLSGISLAVWFVTNITFNVAHIPFNTLNSHTYCSIAAFALSTLLGTYVLREKFKAVARGLKLVLITVNIFLIYATANGVHAVYSGTFFQVQGKSEAFAIPFISPQPWWPDKE